MIYFNLNEAFLDDNKEFYDYHTKVFDGKNPFDTTKGESAFVQQLLHDAEYMAEYKNLSSEFVQMTPRQYFEGCAEIFGSSVDTQINQTKNDVNTLNKLKKVLTVYRRTFPVTYLNYAEKGQEGRHRMYVVGELLGWDKKFPVLIVNWYNQEIASKEAAKKEQERKERILYIIEWAFDYAKDMYCTDVLEFIDELKKLLEKKFDEDEITITENGVDITAKVQDVSKTMPLDELNIDSLYDLDIEDLL